jgi:hypothetical protein
MKRHFRILTAFVTLLLFLSMHTVSVAQPPPPPPSLHGMSGNQKAPDGGAPVGNGTYILLTLAAGYAFRKMYLLRKTTTVVE